MCASPSIADICAAHTGTGEGKDEMVHRRAEVAGIAPLKNENTWDQECFHVILPH